MVRGGPQFNPERQHHFGFGVHTSSLGREVIIKIAGGVDHVVTRRQPDHRPAGADLAFSLYQIPPVGRFTYCHSLRLVNQLPTKAHRATCFRLRCNHRMRRKDNRPVDTANCCSNMLMHFFNSRGKGTRGTSRERPAKCRFNALDRSQGWRSFMCAGDPLAKIVVVPLAGADASPCAASCSLSSPKWAALFLLTPPCVACAIRNGIELYFVIFARSAGSVALTNTIPRNVFTINSGSLWRLIVDTLRFWVWTRRNAIDAVIDFELFSRFSVLFTGLSGANRQSRILSLSRRRSLSGRDADPSCGLQPTYSYCEKLHCTCRRTHERHTDRPLRQDKNRRRPAKRRASDTDHPRRATAC